MQGEISLNEFQRTGMQIWIGGDDRQQHNSDQQLYSTRTLRYLSKLFTAIFIPQAVKLEVDEYFFCSPNGKDS